MSRLKVKIINPFMYNGKLLKAGEEVELDFNKAVRHMRVGDVEKNEAAIKEYKASQKAAAEAALKDSQAEW